MRCPGVRKYRTRSRPPGWYQRGIAQAMVHEAHVARVARCPFTSFTFHTSMFVGSVPPIRDKNASRSIQRKEVKGMAWQGTPSQVKATRRRNYDPPTRHKPSLEWLVRTSKAVGDRSSRFVRRGGDATLPAPSPPPSVQTCMQSRGSQLSSSPRRRPWAR